MPALAQSALMRRGLQWRPVLRSRFIAAALCASGAFFAWQLLPDPVSCVAFTLACAFMSALLLCDLQKRLLPTGIVAGLLVLGLIFRLCVGGLNECVQLTVAAALCAFGLFAVNAIHMKVHANDLIGAGDIRMILPLVLFSGFQGALPGLLVGSLIMGTASLFLLVARNVKGDTPIALAPGLYGWLLVGTLIPFA